jgi:biopolymer transport protein ExbD
MIGCTDQNIFLIRVEQDAIFVNNKKIANTADVAKQDTFVVEALKNVLENKKDTSKKVLIQVDPEQSYDVFFKVATTCGYSDFTDVSIITKINGNDYSESISMSKREKTGEIPELEPQCLCLSVLIAEDCLRIWARGTFLPNIFHKENLDSIYDKLSEHLITIYNHFIDDYLSDIGYIGADSDVKISNVIPIMHRLRTAGPTKIKLTQPFVIECKDDFF